MKFEKKLNLGTCNSEAVTGPIKSIQMYTGFKNKDLKKPVPSGFTLTTNTGSYDFGKTDTFKMPIYESESKEGENIAAVTFTNPMGRHSDFL